MTCAMLNLCGSYRPLKICGGKKPCPRRKICALWKLQNAAFEKPAAPASASSSSPEPSS